jgi:hypothetical protein
MRYPCLNRSGGSRPFVRPILEIILTQSPVYLRKRRDSIAGLALIRPESENA